VGWAIIGLSSFILLWNTYFILFDALKALLRLLVSPFRRKNKIFPSINVKDSSEIATTKKNKNNISGIHVEEK